MEYLYYKGKNGNFGDDLNAWLWPKIFGAEDKKDNTCFLGIGTILYNKNKFLQGINDKQKIVFGSGVRPAYERFEIDEKWDIRFLRGPLSANSLDNRFKYITDAAYALNLLKEFEDIKQTEKKYEISFMPYFKSMPYLNWEKICSQVGLHYISPFSENGVEFTLKEIAASKYVIAEAMHGAIAADILRVPWHRFVLSTPITEGGMVSEFKWMDWLYSVQLHSTDTTFVKLYKESYLHDLVDRLSFKAIHAQFFLKGVTKKEVLEKLAMVKNYFLSKDNVVDDINNRLLSEVHQLVNQRN